MGLIKVIFTGEFALVMFLMVAYFKTVFEFLPIDATLVFFILTIFVAFKRNYRDPKILTSTAILFAFYGVFLISVMIGSVHTESVVYLREKALKVFVVMSWTLVSVPLIIKQREHLERFLKSFVIIAVFMGAAGYVSFSQELQTGSYDGRLDVWGMGYLPLGRTVCLGLVYLIAWRYFSMSESRSRLVTLIAIVSLLVIALLGGARMPLFGLLVVVCLFIFLSFKVQRGEIRVKKKSLMLFTLISLLTVSVLFIIATGRAGDALSRITSLFSGNDASAIERLGMLEVAREMIKDNPLFGQGFASYPLRYIGLDVKDYPHNIFVETLAELGLFGLVPLVLMLLLALYTGFVVYKKKNSEYDYLQLTVIGMFLFFLINSNTMGDITDNRVLFAFVALMTISPFIRRRNEYNPTVSKN